MSSWLLNCLAPRARGESDESLAQPTSASNINININGRGHPGTTGSLARSHAYESSFFTSLFADIPMIVTVISSDTLDDIIGEQSKPYSPIHPASPFYQSKLAIAWYQSVIQVEHVTARFVLACLFRHHSKGFRGACEEMRDAIHNEETWKDIVCIKARPSPQPSGTLTSAEVGASIHGASILGPPGPAVRPLGNEVDKDSSFHGRFQGVQGPKPIPKHVMPQSTPAFDHSLPGGSQRAEASLFRHRSSQSDIGESSPLPRTAMMTSCLQGIPSDKSIELLPADASESSVSVLPSLLIPPPLLDYSTAPFGPGDDVVDSGDIFSTVEAVYLASNATVASVAGDPMSPSSYKVDIWQEVIAKPFHAVSGQGLIIITQYDITALVSEGHKAREVLDGASDTQLELLKSMFPQHVIDHLLDDQHLLSRTASFAPCAQSPGLVGASVRGINQGSVPAALLHDAARDSGRGTAAGTRALVGYDRSSMHVIRPRGNSLDLAHLPTKGFEKLARSHQGVTILFMDIVGFTSMSKQVDPGTVMSFLNTLFSQFDGLTDQFGVQKIETAGDCYVAATGILQQDGKGGSVVVDQSDAVENAMSMMRMAKAMLLVSRRVKMPHNRQPVSIRIGMATGDCVTGLIGSKLPKFSVFGDTMNTASRMESTATPGQVQVTESTWQLLKDMDHWTATGRVEIKGKGLMNTYCWAP